jgi:hypothetical protein
MLIAHPIGGLRHDVHMAADSDMRTPKAAPGARIVALRGELWRQHTDLHDIGPTDARYPKAVTELLDLTAELLAAEAHSSAQRRAARRRVVLAVYCLGSVLVIASVAFVVAMPGLGTWTFRAVGGAVPVLIVLVVMVLLARRRQQDGTGLERRPRQPERRPVPLAGARRPSSPTW